MKIDKENALAGIVAVVALVAIICELIFGGISTASIAGAVKDIAGITVDILVFLLAFRAFAKKEDKTFRGKLESAMEEIEKSYAPLIQEHKAKETNQSDVNKNVTYIRYDIANKVEALFGVECNDYMRFFEINAQTPEKITFFVRKKFFGEPFTPDIIAEHIKGFCDKNYNQYSTTYSVDKDGASITVSFGKTLETCDEIKSLISIVDDVLLLYIAEYKKK